MGPSTTTTVETTSRLEQRRQARAQLALPIHVSRHESRTVSHPACMRDVNVRGAFFYCDMQLTVGQRLRVELGCPAAQTRLQLSCEAQVVRVESSPGALSGVAVEFLGFEVHSGEEKSQTPISVVDWGLAMVEHKFARRPELQMYAARIQGAA
jgi:hypothetical protein